MVKKNIVSFDLDGTLADTTFTSLVWEVGIPKLYADKYGLELAKATSLVTSEYEKIGDSSLKWYDIAYWFDFFDLPGDWEGLLEEHRDKTRPFPEVKEVIEAVGQHFDLIITSNAAREFVEIELEEMGIADYFTRIFSVTSDFGMVKKTRHCYEQICSTMKIRPANTIHVGDHFEFDYLVPKSLGIQAYFLDRDGKRPKERSSVRNLMQFADLISPAI
ncbi:MAG: HAD family hydrolase [Thermodesulfobacteriota bacterium]|nr:HAD family hydrolase [Thermodesulfobacteriota bacterium]